MPNTRETFGRKEVPEKIKVKIKIINYQERVKEEIEEICVSIYNKKFETTRNENNKKKIEEAKLCGTLMMEINKQETLTPWSLIDISKLFTRLYKQFLQKDNFKGMTIEYNILFYILSSTNDSLVNERIELICKLIANVFKKEKLYNEIKDLYKEYPILKKTDINEEKRNLYIQKGNVTLYYRAFEQDLYNELKNLPSVLDALFKMIISSDDEPLLISGPSSFKKYLAQKFLKTNNIEIISLNSEITMSQLIGSNVPIIKEESKLFYLKAIYEF